MITKTFDMESEPMITPGQIEPKEGIPTMALVCFSTELMKALLELADQKGDLESIGDMGDCAHKHPVYHFSSPQEELILHQSFVGGPCSGADLEDLFALGVERALYFGSCGTLVDHLMEGHIFVPMAAYRDEGMSYHYKEASTWIDVPSNKKLAQVLRNMGVPVTEGKTWTTDAFYRETQNTVKKRLEAGCSVVEMECASLAAVAEFRGKEFYQFLYSADSLAGKVWDKRILGKGESDIAHSMAALALEAAFQLL